MSIKGGLDSESATKQPHAMTTGISSDDDQPIVIQDAERTPTPTTPDGYCSANDDGVRLDDDAMEEAPEQSLMEVARPAVPTTTALCVSEPTKMVSGARPEVTPDDDDVPIAKIRISDSKRQAEGTDESKTGSMPQRGSKRSKLEGASAPLPALNGVSTKMRKVEVEDDDDFDAPQLDLDSPTVISALGVRVDPAAPCNAFMRQRDGHHQYNGNSASQLVAAAARLGFSDGRWVTAWQAEQMGFVPSGAKTLIRCGDSSQDSNNKGGRTITLFNVQQLRVLPRAHTES